MQPLPHADALLRASLACDEHIKSCTLIGLLLEFAAGVAAATAAFGGPFRSYAPILAVVLVSLATASFISANSKRAIARRSRRLALEALAFAEDVPGGVAAQIQSALPRRIDARVRKLPATNLSQYFDPNNPPGFARFRECYAHSILYSRALAKRLALPMLAASALTLFIMLIVFYVLAVSPHAGTRLRVQFLDFLTACILLLIGVRTAATGFGAFFAYSHFSMLFQRFLDVTDPVMLNDLSISYELACMQSPLVPTYLYRRHRELLAQMWLEVRDQFVPHRASAKPTEDSQHDRDVAE